MTGDAARLGLGDDFLSKFASQQVRGVEEVDEGVMSLDGFSNVTDAFDQEEAGLFARFSLTKAAGLFDLRVLATGNGVGRHIRIIARDK